MKRIFVQFPLMLLIADAGAILLALLLAFYLRVVVSQQVEVLITWQEFLLLVSLLLPLWLLLFGMIGLYSKPVYERRPSELGRIVLGAFMGVLLMIGVDFLLGDIIFQARLIAVYGLALTIICLAATRLLMQRLRLFLFKYKIGVAKVAVVGNSSAAVEIIESLKNTHQSGYQLVAVNLSAQQYQQLELPKTVKRYDRLQGFVQSMEGFSLDTIILTDLHQATAGVREIIEAALRNHTEVRIIPSDNDILGSATRLEIFQSRPMLIAYQTPLNEWGRLIKRAFDVVGSLLSLILLSPVLLFAMAAIKLAEPSDPVFFKQKRITKFGRTINVYKLRTMRHKYSGSPIRAFTLMGRPDLVDKIKQDGYQLQNDPRVTPIGAFLRPRSLDELPQLINVFKGDLSLVGPRAMTPQELKDHQSSWPILLSVKAGITGLAQVNGRNNLSTTEKVRFSVYYAQNWSIWLDISIILKTIIKVIRREGVIT